MDVGEFGLLDDGIVVVVSVVVSDESVAVSIFFQPSFPRK